MEDRVLLGPNLAPGGGGAGVHQQAKRMLADLFLKYEEYEALIGVLMAAVVIGFVAVIAYTVIPDSKRNGQDTPLDNPRTCDGVYTTQTPSNVLPTPAIVSQANMSANQYSVEPCPKDWMYYGKYCYFFEENETNWSRSNSSCSKRKGWLVTFKDRGEMGYILKRACGSSHWIGLTETAEGYKWITGEPLDKSEFTIHGDGECGHIMSQTNNVYISLATCSLPRSSICKMAPYKGGNLSRVE